MPTYNADGLRVRKTVTLPNETNVITNYTLHGKNIVHMTQSSNNLHFWYDASNRPAVVEFNETKYSYVHNLQGDICQIIDANGNVVVEYKKGPQSQWTQELIRIVWKWYGL